MKSHLAPALSLYPGIGNFQSQESKAIVLQHRLTGFAFLFSFLMLSFGVKGQTVLPGPNIGDEGSVTFYYQGQKVTYTTVRAADSNVWLQQNLGSQQVATVITDVASYGDYFQWGRWDDGHQSRTSLTHKLTSSITPNDPTGLRTCRDSFLVVANDPSTGLSVPPYWWGNGDEHNTWTSNPPSATNGFSPCAVLGDGWHLGDSTEWANILALENITNPNSAFTSNLKIPASGYKGMAGTLLYEGGGFIPIQGYWTSTPTEQYSGPMSGGYYAWPGLGQMSSSYAQAGHSIRCLLAADAVPGGLIAPDILCRSDGEVILSMPPIGIAAYYTWELPDGWEGESDSNNITVKAGYQSGMITAYAFNLCDDTLAVRTKEVFVSYSEPVINVNVFELGVTGGEFTSYQWLKDGDIIRGASDSTYTVEENGIYQVVVTNEYGCMDTSDIYEVRNVSIKEWANIAKQITVYPNPSDNIIQINTPISIHFQLLSADGRIVITKEKTNSFSVKELAGGVYFLRITDVENRLIKIEKIVRQ